MKAHRIVFTCARCNEEHHVDFKWVSGAELQDLAYNELARLAFCDEHGLSHLKAFTLQQSELFKSWHAMQLDIVRTRAGRSRWMRESAIKRMEKLMRQRSKDFLAGMVPDAQEHWRLVLERSPGSCLLPEPVHFTMKL